MLEVLKNLEKVIDESEISEEEKNDLLVFLPALPKELLEELYKLFEENFDLIKEFNENFKSKIKALTGGGDETWDEIIEEEARKKGELEEKYEI